MDSANVKMPWDCPIAPGTAEIIFSGIEPVLPVSWADASMLDFGAGGGRYCRMFAQRIPAGQIIAAEIEAERMVELQGHGFQAVHLEGKADDLHFIKDESLHLVFSSNVLEHIPRPLYGQYLSEIKRILVPGGVFFVGMPNYPWKRLYDLRRALREKENRRYYLFDDPTHVNKMSLGRFVRDLEQMAFEGISLKPGYAGLSGFVSKRFGTLDQTSFLSRFCNKYSGVALKGKTYV